MAADAYDRYVESATLRLNAAIRIEVEFISFEQAMHLTVSWVERFRVLIISSCVTSVGSPKFPHLRGNHMVARVVHCAAAINASFVRGFSGL